MNLKSGKNGGIRMFPKSRQFFAIHGSCALPLLDARHWDVSKEGPGKLCGMNKLEPRPTNRLG